MRIEKPKARRRWDYPATALPFVLAALYVGGRVATIYFDGVRRPMIYPLSALYGDRQFHFLVILLIVVFLVAPVHNLIRFEITPNWAIVLLSFFSLCSALLLCGYQGLFAIFYQGFNHTDTIVNEGKIHKVGFDYGGIEDPGPNDPRLEATYTVYECTYAGLLCTYLDFLTGNSEVGLPKPRFDVDFFVRDDDLFVQIECVEVPLSDLPNYARGYGSPWDCE